MPILGEKALHGMRAYAGSLPWRYRRLTWSGRALPDFIVVGAQKSGTTSMFAYLSQHPQLLAPSKEEVHFFDGGLDPRIDSFKKGKPWYCAHFPLQKQMSPGQKTFETSPLYIFNPLAPRRIADLLPRVKMIALLRNPTERAISHYFHERRKGKEPLPISQAFQEENRRLEPVIKSGDYKNLVFIHQSYKARGLYKEQLERYFRYFSREQILVISSEEFFAKPDLCLRRVFAFVGVDPEYRVSNLMPRNVANNKSEVEPGVSEYLDSFFKPHNQELYEMLGEDYGW
jgi:hypothetical protein